MIYWVLSAFSLIVPLKNSLKAVMWLNHKTALICVSLLREWYSSLPDGMPWNHCFLYLMYFVCFKCEGKSGLSSVSSVAQSCLSLWDPQGLQHARLSCPSPTPGACSNSCPSSWWCYPTILSSVVPFSSCLQSFPASGAFPVSQFFTSGGQSIGVSASRFWNGNSRQSLSKR